MSAKSIDFSVARARPARAAQRARVSTRAPRGSRCLRAAQRRPGPRSRRARRAAASARTAWRVPADHLGTGGIQHREHRRLRLELRRAQQRRGPRPAAPRARTARRRRGSPRRGEDHARRAGQRRVEALDPARTAGRDAGAHEVVAVERQHDVHLGARVERRLQHQQVGAAGGRREHDRRVPAGRAFAQRSRRPPLRDAPGSAAFAVRRVDHVAGERDDVARAQHRQHRGRGRQHAREQPQLAAHRSRCGRYRAVALRPRLRVPFARPGSIAAQERRLGRRSARSHPASAPPRAAQRGSTSRGQRACGIALAEQHRQRRGIDAGVRIARERVRGEVLVARARLAAASATATGRRAVQRVLPQPAAQARGSRRAGAAPATPPLRPIEQRVRLARRAGARVRERAAVERAPRRRDAARRPRGTRRTRPTARRARGGRECARRLRRHARAVRRPPYRSDAAIAARRSPSAAGARARQCARARSRRRAAAASPAAACP